MKIWIALLLGVTAIAALVLLKEYVAGICELSPDHKHHFTEWKPDQFEFHQSRRCTNCGWTIQYRL